MHLQTYSHSMSLILTLVPLLVESLESTLYPNSQKACLAKQVIRIKAILVKEYTKSSCRHGSQLRPLASFRELKV